MNDLGVVDLHPARGLLDTDVEMINVLFFEPLGKGFENDLGAGDCGFDEIVKRALRQAPPVVKERGTVDGVVWFRGLLWLAVRMWRHIPDELERDVKVFLEKLPLDRGDSFTRGHEHPPLRLLALLSYFFWEIFIKKAKLYA